MGGEGSENLRLVYIKMGYNYLSGNGNYEGGMMGYMRNIGMMNGFNSGGIFMGIIIFVILGSAAYFTATSTRKNYTPGSDNTETALEILKKRYAKGEISKEEFEEKKPFHNH